MNRLFKTTNKLHFISFFLALVIICVLFLNFGCTSCKRKDTSSEKTEISLRLKWLWYAGWAGELVALNQNVWGDHNLSVTIEPGGFELDPIKLVAAGTDDIGIAGADQILLAREKGIPLVAFAIQYQISPVGFVAMKKSGINSIVGFRGKTIGVKYGTDVEPVYRALLSSNGVDEKELNEVAVKFDLTPFFSGKIDIYPGYLTNDLLIPEERGFEVVTIRAADYDISVYGNVYFCTESFLLKNPNIVLKFYQGISKAWKDALSMDPLEIVNLALQINESLNLDHEINVVKSLPPYIIPEGTTFGSMAQQDWRKLYDMLHEQGVLKKDFDYTKAFTLEILKKSENDRN